MNKFCFKTVFSERLGALVAVGEHASSQGKANGGTSFSAAAITRHGGVRRYIGALTTSFALVTLAWAQPAVNALPTGGQVAQGAVQFSQSAQQLNIHQASDRAAVNWQSFDIGAAAKVNVVQPSAQSVLLNRVGGTAPSQIFGQLSANGRVILVNPNGMVFGKDGSVSASAFTGSTLNISDADFMAGNERYTRDGAAGAIVNRGLIQVAPGGYVALLGASVSNEGRIVAPQGDVYLAAADAVAVPSTKVAVPIGQSGRIKLELTPASINAAVANQKGGTIVTEGGQVYLQAAAVNAALATIIQSGSIDTTGEQGGAVHVLADGGHIRVHGSIQANSTGKDDKGQKLVGGDIYIGRDKDTNVLAAVADVSGARLESKGGFVETSGDYLVTTGTRVIAKDWLLDPTNITIQTSGASGTPYNADFSATATSVILATDIKASLDAGTSVTLQTTDTPGDTTGGNIAVNASISKTSGTDATLTLKAHNNITVANGVSISASGSGNKLNVVFNSDVDNSGEGGILMNGGSSILSNGGNITLGGGVTGDGTGYAQSVASIGVNLSGTIIDAGAGNFTAKGKSGTGQGVLFSGTNTITAAQYTIDGQSTNAAAVYKGSGNTTFNSTGNGLASSIKGSSGGRGVFIYAGTLNFNANNGSNTTLSSGQGEMRLGFGGGVTVNTHGNVTLGSDQSGFFSQAQTNVESGTLTIKGKSAGHGVAIQDGSGVATKISVKNGSHLVIDGESTGSGSGIHLLPVGVANNIEMSGQNASVFGSITMTGVSAAGLGISTSVTPITSDGGDITLTGTSNGANGTGLNLGGVIRSGNATSGGQVTLNGTTNATGSGAGIDQSGSVQGGVVAMTGTAAGTNNAIFSSGSIRSTVGDISIEGTNTNASASGGGGVTLRGTVTAKTDVVVEGYSHGTLNQAVVIQNAVESQTGNITVIGETKAATQRTVAIANNGDVNGSLKTSAANKSITIQANTLLLAGAATVVDSGSTGTVNIKTYTAGNDILLGGGASNDVMSATLSSQKLGLDQAELNRIASAHLVVGDAVSADNITVSGAASTNASVGRLTLQSAGHIVVNAPLSVGDDPLTPAVTESSQNLTLIAGGAISSGAVGKLSAANLSVTAGSTIGSASQSLATNVSHVSMNSGGDQYLLEDNGVSLAARTTGNGHISAATLNGTLTISSVNGISGIQAGTGDVVLNAISGSGHGLILGDGIAVTGGNITMRAEASSNTVGYLGYYGQGGAFIASGALNLTGISANGGGNGFYSFGGSMTAANGIAITGTSGNGQGIGFDRNVSFTNTGGDVVFTGRANGTHTQAIGLRGTSITNSGGATRLLALSGNVFTNSEGGTPGQYWGLTGPLTNTITHSGSGLVEISAGTSSTDTGAIDGKVLTIHQNGVGGVLVKTAGLGNVTVPQIINAGTGDVRVAAGNLLSAGDASGGQVLTVAGNTIAQTNATPGQTYVYTGSLAGTGLLSRLGTYFDTLHYNGSTHDLNAAFGSAFGATMMGESSTQVLFRETISSAPRFALNLAGVNLSKTYGDVDPDVLVGLATAYTGPAMLTSTVSGVGGNHVFGLAAADALASLTGLRTAGENASATPYAYSLTAGLNTSVSGQAGLLINKKTLSAALQGTVTKEYDGTAEANLTNNHFALTGWVGTEGATVSQAAGSYASKNVADNTGAGEVTADLAAQHFTPTGSTLLSNYTLPTSASGNVGTITRAPLTVKVGNTAMFVTQDPNAAFDPGITYEGLKNGETPADVLGVLSRTYTGGANPAEGPHTGVYRTATTPSADNYTVNWQWGNLNVVPADKLLIQVGGRSQTYGAVTAANAGHTTAAQGLSAQYCVGRVNCNTISTLTLNDVGSGNWRATDTLGSTILFSTSVNTSGKTSAAGFLNVGNHNYAVGSWSVQGGQNFTDMVLAGGALTVTPKALSLSAHGMSKVYDGTNALASTSLMPDGVLAGDDVGVVSSGGSFTSKLVGQQSFSLSGLQLQGADKANYSFASGVVTGTGSITPKLLSASFGALDKVYDGNTSASLTEGSLSGLIAGDEVSIGGASAAFADPNVARDANGQVIAKSVLMGGVSLAGADAGNYQVVASVGNARITPKALTATVQADDKVYDGSRSAVVMASTAGVVGGDAVGVALGSASFASKNVVRNANGEVVDQTVSVSGMQLTGAQAGNYELTSTSATDQAKISPMLLLPSAAVSDKVYDGQVDAVFSGLGGGVLVQGDDVRFAADGARFASPDVARNAQGQVMTQEVTVSGLRLQGPDAGNYGLQGNVNQFKTVASILPRPLSIDAKALDKVYDGTTLATVQWTGVSGWVGAERLGVSALAEFDSPDAGPGKPVSVLYTLDRGVNGAKASNYNLVSPTLKASILTGQGVKPVQPVVVPDSGSTSSSVIQFVSSPVAAVGEKLVQTPEQDLTNNCLQDGLNSCDCEETLISEVQACFTPRHKLSPLVTPSNLSSPSKNL